MITFILCHINTTTMNKAPRNHTSVYFNEYIKDHWQELLEIQAKQGFTSYNAMHNHMVAQLIQDYSLIMSQKNTNAKKRINMNDDSKLRVYSDGEELYLLNVVNDLRNTIIGDMKVRGIKL